MAFSRKLELGSSPKPTAVTLFRSAAVAANEERYDSLVHDKGLDPLRHFLWIVPGILCVFGAAILNFGLQPVRLEGSIKRYPATAMIRSPQAGLLDIDFIKGARVEANTVIAKIRTDTEDADTINGKRERELERLKLARKTLDDQLAVEQLRLDSTLSKNAVQRQSIDQQIESLSQQINALAGIESIRLSKVEQSKTLLEKRVISSADQNTVLEHYLSAVNDRFEQEVSRSGLRKARADLDGGDQAARQAYDEAVLRINAEADKLDQNIRALSAPSELQLKTPIAGIVSNILPAGPTVIQAATPIASIIPDDQKVFAQFDVPADMLGMVLRTTDYRIMTAGLNQIGKHYRGRFGSISTMPVDEQKGYRLTLVVSGDRPQSLAEQQSVSINFFHVKDGSFLSELLKWVG